MDKEIKDSIFDGIKDFRMPKRLYFRTTEKTTTEKTAWVEIDTDYTQVYDCFSKISVKLKSVTSIKLLFWLLSCESNKSNGIASSNEVHKRFNKYLVENSDEKDVEVTSRTFYKCFEELTSIKVLTKVGRGQYYLNPHFFWRDEIKKRNEFILDEQKENRFLSYNPIDEQNKILAQQEAGILETKLPTEKKRPIKQLKEKI